MLAGREKGGKSTLCGYVAARVTRGETFLDGTCDAGNVLIVSLEEGLQETAQRLVAFGADPTKVFIMTREHFDGYADVMDVAEEVQPKLIIWDSLAAIADMVSSGTPDPGNASAWTRIVQPMVDISRVWTGVTIHHARKADGKYRDSTAIGAQVDVIAEMSGEGDAPRVLKFKARVSIPETRVTLRDNAFELLESARDLQNRVLAYIAANPRSSWRDVRDGVPGRATELAKARDILLKDGKILNAGTSAKAAYTASANVAPTLTLSTGRGSA